MKRFIIVLAIVLLALAAGGFSDGGDDAEAGTVVIVGTDGGGVGPTPPSDGGGTYYCQPVLNGQVAWLFGWPLRCQFRSSYGGWHDPVYGQMFGCGPSYYPCWVWYPA